MIWTDHEIISERLKPILAKWARTPYKHGMQREKVGVDCLRFVSAVWDELFSLPPYNPALFPADTSLFSKEKTYSAVRELINHYDAKIISTETVQPGDAVVTRNKANPCHILIVGHQKNTVWHSDRPGGVWYAGLLGLSNIHLIARHPSLCQ